MSFCHIFLVKMCFSPNMFLCLLQIFFIMLFITIPIIIHYSFYTPFIIDYFHVSNQSCPFSSALSHDRSSRFTFGASSLQGQCPA